MSQATNALAKFLTGCLAMVALPAISATNLNTDSWSPRLVLQAAHTEQPMSLVMSPSGRFIITCDYFGVAKLWTSGNHELLWSFKDYGARAESGSAALFSRDESKVYYYRWTSDAVDELDLATGKVERRFSAPKEGFSALQWANDGCLQTDIYAGRPVQEAPFHYRLARWDVSTGQRNELEFDDEPGRVEGFPDGRVLGVFLEGDDCFLKDLRSGKKHLLPYRHIPSEWEGRSKIRMANVAFSPTGRQLALQGVTGMDLVDTASGTVLFHSGQTASARPTFSNDGSFLWFAKQRDEAKGYLVNCRTFQVLDVNGFASDDLTFAVSEDRLVAALVEQPSLSAAPHEAFISTTTGKRLGLLTAPGQLGQAVFSADGKSIFGMRGEFVGFDIASGVRLPQCFGEGLHSISNLCLAPSETFLVQSNWYGPSLFYWNLDTGRGNPLALPDVRAFRPELAWLTDDERQFALTDYNTHCTILYNSPGSEHSPPFDGFAGDNPFLGNLLVTSGNDGFEAFPVDGFKPSTRLSSEKYLDYFFSSDKKVALTHAPDSNRCDLWDMTSFEHLRTLNLEPQSTRWFVAFARSGNFVIAIDRLGNMEALDARTGRMIWDHRKSPLPNKSEEETRRVLLSPDDRFFVTWAEVGAKTPFEFREAATGNLLFSLDGKDSPSRLSFSPSGKFLVGYMRNSGQIRIWRMGSSDKPLDLPVESNSIGQAVFADDERKIFVCDGAAWKVFDLPSGRLLLTTVTNGTDWIAVDPEGRFDMSSFNAARLVRWVSSDEPLRPLAPEQYMKAFYTPGLIAAVLNNIKSRQVPSVTGLNRALPVVRIEKVISFGARAKVAIRVEAAKADPTRPHQRTCLARDLKVFRDGQLVQFLNGKVQTGLYTFLVDLPSERQADFSAYAFNDDGVKSPDATASLRASEAPQHRTAYVLAVGCNLPGEQGFEPLKYAVTDAQTISSVLPPHLVGFDSIVSKALANPSRLAIFDALNHVAKVAKPGDALLFFWSGHGDTDTKGDFYLLPSSGGRISASDFARWLVKIDSEQISVVLDTCRSERGVSTPGFKPGPFADQSLGQLAFDKGVAILCASRGAAFELKSLGHGLLTHVLITQSLVRKGLGSQPVGVDSWFKFTEEAVAKIPLEGLASVRSKHKAPKVPGAQRPAFFNFMKHDRRIIEP